MSPGAIKLERSIFRSKTGRFQVHFRRGAQWFSGGFETLTAARQFRDDMEKRVPKRSLPCSGSAEEWWARRAAQLAAQMKVGGVRLFTVEQLPSGKYAFTVEPSREI